MTTHSQSADEAFEAWFKANASLLVLVNRREKRLMRDAWTAGWRAALAAQQQAHKEATRRIEKALEGR